MKKYITAAALLAAGTAFANAATVVSLTDLSSDKTFDNGVSYSAESGTFTASASAPFVAQETTSADSSPSTRYAISVTFGLDLSALGMASAGSSYSASTMLVECTLNGNTSGAAGLMATSLGLQLAWSGVVYSTPTSTTDVADIAVTWDTLRGLADDSGLVLLTLETGARRGPLTSGSSAGTQVYDGKGGNVDFKNTSTGATGTGYGYGALKGSTQYNTVSVNTDYVTAVSIFAGSASSSEIAEASSAIPEPSAFGLLAGVGALALVAARRRRKA